MEQLKKRYYLLGVDIGTLGSKGVITDTDGAILAQQLIEHEVLHTQPGWMEHDPDKHWWSDFVKIVVGLLDQSKIPSREIRAICISGLFPAFCPTDEYGLPLRNAILYADSRAADYVEHVSAIAQTPLKGDEVTPKLLWLRKNEPDVFRRTRMIFAPHGYVVYRLTGQHCIDHYTAFRFGGIVDNSRSGWREEVCLQLGISPEILPSIHPPSHVIGEVSAAAAIETGLAPGTPVLVGPADTYATLLGTGAIDRGDAMVYYGTTGCLTVCSCTLEKILYDSSVIASDSPYILATYLLGSGELLKWCVDQFCQSELVEAQELKVSPYQLLDERAAAIRPGSDSLLILPYFSGRILPVSDPLAKGVIFGLTMSHTRAHIWRALLESFGYGILEGLEALRKRGIAVRRLFAAGGGAQSEAWRQIVSDIVGLPQEYPNGGGAPLGDAYLAGYGVGLFKDFATIKDNWLRLVSVTEPRSQMHSIHQKLFRVYTDLSFVLRDVYEELADAIPECPGGSSDSKPMSIIAIPQKSPS